MSVTTTPEIEEAWSNYYEEWLISQWNALFAEVGALGILSPQPFTSWMSRAGVSKLYRYTSGEFADFVFICSPPPC